MKICPNCGSKMDPSVNFCTNCGTDIRNVPLDSAQQAAKTEPKVQATAPVATEPAQSTTQATMPTRRSQMTQPTQVTQAVEQQFNNQNNGQTSVISEHASNMWEWFVNSWKHPFTEQNAESWYGWVTLLVENILLILGLYLCINKFAQNQLGNSDMGQAAQGIVANFSTSLLFELFLYLILTAAAMIAAAYYSHKFVYGQTENIFTFVNRIVACSNLNAILFVVSFVCLIIGSDDMLKLGLPLVAIAMLIFSLATYTAVVGDSAPSVQDKFYGLLIVVAVQLIVMFILGKIFGQAVYGQVQNFIHGSFNGMF